MTESNCSCPMRRRDLASTVRLGLDRTDAFVALRSTRTRRLSLINGALIRNFADGGAGARRGIHHFQYLHGSSGCFTSTVPVDAYRGAGRPQD